MNLKHMLKNLMWITLVLFVLTACSNPSSSQTTNSASSSNTSSNTQTNIPASESSVIKAGTRKNPLPYKTTALFDGMDTIFDTYKAEITLLEVVRGDKAWEMAKAANQFNTEPGEEKEYIFA